MKRGISPLLSVVMIVGLTIITGIFVFTFGIDLINNLTGNNKEVQEGEDIEQQQITTRNFNTFQEIQTYNQKFITSNAIVKDNSISYLTKDYLGSTRAITNENGNKVYEQDYLPYGKQVRENTNEEEHTYTGKEYDEQIDLYYYGARYYNPDTGRFTQVDPIPSITSPYESFRNNPNKYIDPDGRISMITNSEIENIGYSFYQHRLSNINEAYDCTTLCMGAFFPLSRGIHDVDTLIDELTRSGNYRSELLLVIPKDANFKAFPGVGEAASNLQNSLMPTSTYFFRSSEERAEYLKKLNVGAIPFLNFFLKNKYNNVGLKYDPDHAGLIIDGGQTIEAHIGDINDIQIHDNNRLYDFGDPLYVAIPITERGFRISKYASSWATGKANNPRVGGIHSAYGKSVYPSEGGPINVRDFILNYILDN